jgi:hypothetical protein
MYKQNIPHLNKYLLSAVLLSLKLSVALFKYLFIADDLPLEQQNEALLR